MWYDLTNDIPFIKNDLSFKMDWLNLCLWKAQLHFLTLPLEIQYFLFLLSLKNWIIKDAKILQKYIGHIIMYQNFGPLRGPYSRPAGLPHSYVYPSTTQSPFRFPIIPPQSLFVIFVLFVVVFIVFSVLSSFLFFLTKFFCILLFYLFLC